MNYRHLKVTLLLIMFLLANWALRGSSATVQASSLGQEVPAQKIEAATVVTIPATFNYQGYVRNSDGSLMTGPHNMIVRLYAAPVGGNSLHEERFTNVPVRDGLFNLVLGDSVKLPDKLFLDNAPLYLGIALDGGNELNPRQRLHAVPWALTASTLTPNAIVNGLTNNGPTTLTGLNATGPTILTDLTAIGSVALNADVTVNAIRRVKNKNGATDDSTYATSLRRYTVEAQDNTTNISAPVDDTILKQLCADEDGCTLRLGMRDYSPNVAGTGLLAGFRPIHFSLAKVESNGRRLWRAEGNDFFTGAFFFLLAADNDQSADGTIVAGGCYLTDSTDGTAQGDNEMGFFVINNTVSNTNPEMTCVLTIDD